MKREFFLQDDRSNKFWTIEVAGHTVLTRNGRVGAKARETRTEHPSADAALAAAERAKWGSEMGVRALFALFAAAVAAAVATSWTPIRGHC